MSALKDVDALVMPAFYNCPDYVETIGPEVADLMELFGRTPNPEQRLLLDGSFGMNRHGQLTAFEVFVLASRQNLKTGFFEFRSLGKALLLQRPVQIWTAHKESATDQAIEDFKEMIDASDELSRRVKRITEGKGDKSLEFVNGCKIVFRPRTGKAGQSMSADDVDLDEYFAVEPKHLGSLIPTMSTRAHAQIGGASSAPHAASAAQRAIMARGRAASEGRTKEPRLLYAEWSVQVQIGAAIDGTPIYGPAPCKNDPCTHEIGSEGCIADDREMIKLANPSAGRSGPPAISWDYIEDERRTLQDAIEEYLRERMSSGDEGIDPYALTIFGPAWLDRQTDEPPGAPAAIGIARGYDLAWTSVGVASAGAVPHIGANRRDRGTGWVVTHAKELQDKTDSPIVIDAKGPAGTLIADLKAAGVWVIEAGLDDYLQACSDIYDAVQNAEVTHGDYPELNDAVGAAAKRSVGDRWVWARKTGDVSMLEAVTLALWGTKSVRPTEAWGFYE